MSKTIKRLLFAALICITANVSALQLLPDAPREYVVVKGDTLWDISARYTNDPWMWPEIWYQNSQISNPHLIFPGDVIGLMTINGETRVGIVSRGDASRTVKLSPGTVKLQPTARIESIESAIPAIPVGAIRGFLREHRVVDGDTLTNAPRILSGVDDHLLMGAGSRVYARGDFKLHSADAFGIFRQGQLYTDPETEEILGLEAIDIGLARVIARNGEIGTVELDRTNQQVAVGDVLLPTEDRELITQYFPKSPNGKVAGQILAVSDGVSQVGQYDVVVLNRGERDYLEPGDVLILKKAGAVVFDRAADEKVVLPEERAGSMMVFRTFEKLSYALIMRATRPLKVGDKFTSPE
ncbi:MULTISPECIES: LysM peptidoglycan-binding domain-containing protein [unclassified Oceanobacter]|jgi:nucleoid-associated protein YgaU|uniref:LysM peptidoglycan-binding domain-containing protein n=1 Tax=unclassified Oceanobacter TaxID=2620260 RepID=UPI0026E19DAB|nr:MULTISPECIES: LysM peptidoglycan-binding domain-containing protein [unclassified Oceanobacter]MDO6680863.1 LysM peptidoglycan-binding domain-containing protein [Oceanobacter sp. 5_MG-2023]MDP2504632.1 LysM peptidoglycan-binding domain-containing protein [Oceanobacter sp. 3_MG-2023]MDP2546915.1 LysM peptidoglycan-binding domain-containing protein [Oceanobacter sp. 4_MG-2023]MDP2607737.1 LysM peptidoglycan-binding domain-containing protein [Oceanobacter sp. 1_MG-2023]MDP2611079.1 LysM peptido